MNRILILSIIAVVCFWSCDEKVSNPQITFENNVDSITEVFPGDLFTVKGKIFSEETISHVFYFHQKKDEDGRIEEEGDNYKLETNGDNSFNLSFIAEPTTIGIKVIAQDTKGNRSVKIFKVIQGIDDIDITLEEPSFLEDIDSGETFTIKGDVKSKTPITAFTYQILREDILAEPVNIPITNKLEFSFELPIIARNGMTEVILKAKNKGELIAIETFELKNVTAVGPIILFDNETIEVKPDSTFTATGRVTSNQPIESSTYTIIRGAEADSPLSIDLDNDNRFEFNVNVAEDVTAVAVTITDTKGNESMQSMQVSILFPTMIEGDVMKHYKNIILTDEQFFKSYFSFSVAPYVLNEIEAKANQDEVNLMYTNVFIRDGHSVNGPAIFSPNVSGAGTIKGQKLVEGWDKPYNLSRLPAINDFYSTLGKTFDEVEDSNEHWNYIDAFVESKIGGSGVVRQSKVSVGYMFGIGFGGKSAGQIDKYGIAIVRGFGGGKATSSGESTGAWIEIEIKIRK